MSGFQAYTEKGDALLKSGGVGDADTIRSLHENGVKLFYEPGQGRFRCYAQVRISTAPEQIIFEYLDDEGDVFDSFLADAEDALEDTTWRIQWDDSPEYEALHEGEAEGTVAVEPPSPGTSLDELVTTLRRKDKAVDFVATTRKEAGRLFRYLRDELDDEYSIAISSYGRNARAVADADIVIRPGGSHTGLTEATLERFDAERIDELETEMVNATNQLRDESPEPVDALREADIDDAVGVVFRPASWTPLVELFAKTTGVSALLVGIVVLAYFHLDDASELLTRELEIVVPTWLPMRGTLGMVVPTGTPFPAWYIVASAVAVVVVVAALATLAWRTLRPAVGSVGGSGEDDAEGDDDTESELSGGAGAVGKLQEALRDIADVAGRERNEMDGRDRARAVLKDAFDEVWIISKPADVGYRYGPVALGLAATAALYYLSSPVAVVVGVVEQYWLVVLEVLLWATLLGGVVLAVTVVRAAASPVRRIAHRLVDETGAVADRLEETVSARSASTPQESDVGSKLRGVVLLVALVAAGVAGAVMLGTDIPVPTRPGILQGISVWLILAGGLGLVAVLVWRAVDARPRFADWRKKVTDFRGGKNTSVKPGKTGFGTVGLRLIAAGAVVLVFGTFFVWRRGFPSLGVVPSSIGIPEVTSTRMALVGGGAVAVVAVVAVVLTRNKDVVGWAMGSEKSTVSKDEIATLRSELRNENFDEIYESQIVTPDAGTLISALEENPGRTDIAKFIRDCKESDGPIFPALERDGEEWRHVERALSNESNGGGAVAGGTPAASGGDQETGGSDDAGTTAKDGTDRGDVGSESSSSGLDGIEGSRNLLSLSQFRCNAANTGYVDGKTEGTVEGKWTFRISGTPLSPVVIDDTVYIVSENGRIVALDAENGEEVWDDPTHIEDIRTEPTTDGDRLYFGTDDAVCAFNVTSKEVAWSKEIDGEISTPTVWEGRVFVGSTEGELWSFESESGDYRVYDGLETVTTKPAVHSGTVYVAGNQLVEARGMPIDEEWGWTTNVGEDIVAPVSVTEDAVFVVTERAEEGRLVGLNPEDNGKQFAQKDLQGTSPVAPTVVADRVFVGVRTGIFGYMFDPEEMKLERTLSASGADDSEGLELKTPFVTDEGCVYVPFKWEVHAYDSDSLEACWNREIGKTGPKNSIATQPAHAGDKLVVVGNFGTIETWTID
ncbi:outer membrane protein assembly factor BamB family protein [Haloplanus rubicundus]|uniref:Pyrrolo-quinoline quinone repeat domain-containing protein n=1 Tax=Haloplanus rubicundus TaxID=1547898 RepID=A0A345E848_9EURY|nr:PQQ-binding-like beta-propeller repeat protein [Haloplanus rubicundus]AXG08370.1 hypothetical protein DU484_00045 [Haloplanus rubicundus]